MVPEVAQFHHPYMSITRRRSSPPRGSGIAPQCRAQSLLGFTAPRGGSARRPCASCAGAAPSQGGSNPRRFRSLL